MLAELDVRDIEAKPTRDAVDALYRLGYAYHAAADALGISRREGFMLLTGQAPDFTWKGGRDE